MAITIVQFVTGGSISTSGTFFGVYSSWAFNLACSGSFPTPTVAGNTIVLIYWITATDDTKDTQATEPPHCGGGLNNIVGDLNGGSAVGYGYYNGSGSTFGVVSIRFFTNVASMGPSDTITLTADLVDYKTSDTAPITGSAKMEFVLLELSGILTDPDISPLDNSNTGFNSTNTPAPVQGYGDVTHTSGDIIIAAFASGGGAGLSAGSGYTLGLSGSVAAGQSEYWLNAPIGTYNGNFVGSEGLFAQAWIALSPAPGLCGVVKPTGNPYITTAGRR